MNTEEKKLYPYRIFTVSNAFRVLSEYSNIDALWSVILKSDDEIEFYYPERDGSSNLVNMRLKSSYIIAIDDSYGRDQYVAKKEITSESTRPKHVSLVNVGQSVGVKKG